MMEQHSFIHVIHWIRTSILVLSILIIIISLNQYSRKTTPVIALLHENTTAINNHDDGVNLVTHFGQTIIQDRRLIATLVAAQASVFCSLFLLVGKSGSEEEHSCATNSTSSLVGFWGTALDLLCQFLLPLALALSWLFCISFDHKTNRIVCGVMDSQSSTHFLAWLYDDCISTVHGLKYLIVLALIFEMIFITIAWLEYCAFSFNIYNPRKQKHSCLLPTETDHKH